MSPDPAPRARAGALAARYALPDLAADRLAELAELITVDQGAPTTVHELDRVLDDHLADSLVALELDHIPWNGHVADLGAGAGFPGLPLAIALPDTRFSLVESNARKCRFIEAAARRCELDNVAVVRARAELWREGIGACDVVVARALAALPVVAEYAAPLLRLGGALVAWRGRRDATDEVMAAVAGTQLGLDVLDPLPVSPYPGALHRHLHVMVKTGSTPARFPRRPGVARKHPLGRPV